MNFGQIPMIYKKIKSRNIVKFQLEKGLDCFCFFFDIIMNVIPIKMVQTMPNKISLLYGSTI